MIRRRQFITLLGAAAATPFMRPHLARAQQPSMPVIGFLHSASPDPRSAYWAALAAFRRGLNESGFQEGRTVSIEFRWAEDQFARLPALANELVSRKVSLIFAGGGDVAALAAKKATTTIPIVFAIGADPVQQGIVSSLNRPGANATGVTFLSVEIRPKMVELIRELVPKVSTLAVLANPSRPNFQALLDEVLRPALALGLQVRVLKAGSGEEIESAFNTLGHGAADGLLVLSDPVYLNRRDQLAQLEMQNRLPAIHSSREHVIAGSLVSYGASIDEAYYQAGL
jgi:putative ABC transport system substrate-binding protein